MLAGVLTAEYGLGEAKDADVEIGGGAIETPTDAGGAGDCVKALSDAFGVLGGSGGGVKMPIRCRASRSFSSLAALAAALSCCRLILSSSRSFSLSRSISSVMPNLRLILADD